ncbi:hypothetical protein B7G68_18675 [Caulobacter segnis]|uniref:Uncharacterized protein n=2 Tax=Caulobacter segnis TaxID=88688 RepID=D5VNJ9_CAUST|nr:hypothetical protein [Caulobacter segnis]ADG12072.1 conserved hypothetical protein [Caulobacter segnis ATCC 21756]AVQ03683.1 hypothetical protein B7G68_18675 [Caulobacter segnis]
MTQVQAQAWCDRLQAKLMAALDAAWETIASSDDPALIKRARERAKACGEFAAQARKIAAMSPAPRPARPASALPIPFGASEGDVEARPARAIDRLKGGSRGRL